MPRENGRTIECAAGNPGGKWPLHEAIDMMHGKHVSSLQDESKWN